MDALGIAKYVVKADAPVIGFGGVVSGRAINKALENKWIRRTRKGYIATASGKMAVAGKRKVRRVS